MQDTDTQVDEEIVEDTTEESKVDDQETALLEAAREYFIALSAQSSEYREIIDNAKTKPKRDLYQKKLNKVNTEALKVLAGIDRLAAMREANASALEKLVTTEIEQ